MKIMLTFVEATSKGKIGNDEFTIAWIRGPERYITKKYRFTDKLQLKMSDIFDKVSSFYFQKDGY